jgi:hypothetical protein
VEWNDTPEAALSDTERITSAYYRTVVPRIQPTATEQKFTIEVPGVEVPIISFIDVQEEARTSTRRRASRRAGRSNPLAAPGPDVRLRHPEADRVPLDLEGEDPDDSDRSESADMVVPVPTEGRWTASRSS